MLSFVVGIFLLLLCSAVALTPAPFECKARVSLGRPQVNRRQAAAALGSLIAATPLVATADTGAEVRGIPVNPFNGLIFNYRGSDFGGLRAEDINEPSIPYIEFLEKLKAGEVTFVEFKAPAGDAAYATFKDGKSLRVGEGYPIEQPRGYSSPAFAIRAVTNAGVPYKFTVPNIQNYQSGGPQLRRFN